MYSNTTVIGLMDEAYFVPKKELLSWIESVLELEVSCVEDLGSGAVYCQLLDAAFGQKVPMSKVNWKAKFQYEWINNLKIFQQTLDKLGITKKIDIQKLAKARYQDNLELLQWMKRYIELNGMNSENYNALERRNRSTLYSITQKKKALGTSFKTNNNSFVSQQGQTIFMDTSICSTTPAMKQPKPSRVSMKSNTYKNKQNQFNENKPTQTKLTAQMNQIKKVLLCAENSDSKIEEIYKVVFGCSPNMQTTTMEVEGQMVESDEQLVF